MQKTKEKQVKLEVRADLSRSTLLFFGAGPSDASPDEGVVEDLPLIDEKAVDQLTEGLISYYLPDLQQSKSALQELTQNQVVLLETLEQEISKFKECNWILDINALFSEAKHYHNKLVNIRNEIMMLHEKTSKLKKRALKLQQKRQKEELEREQQREKELEREKQLTAKPARRISSLSDSEKAGHVSISFQLTERCQQLE
ncbi:biogenesis of lysosome-related organelles complex 1 subunit 6 [Patagioenas fasciata monilis]|uniref:Biogenesis of lysosome-related organelles complex 1 subunit 6 n=1 Tax=Patagioenas fasciata monilis TaxID=372326 RepID=A0A1V4JER2_PATFA|nr:biogenesis of lysosome-related organelles complex 1 subunit 6 [Patagioenas fasciata monilis]